MNNQSQKLSNTNIPAAAEADSYLNRLTQVIKVVHREDVTWREAKSKLGLQFEQELDGEEIIRLENEYDDKDEELDVFLTEEEFAEALAAPIPDHARFQTFMASRMPRPVTPPQPTFVIENATEVLIQLTSSFMDAWETASEAMRNAILGNSMEFAPVGGVMSDKLSSHDAEGEDTFICGFTKSFETTEDADISEIVCKIFEEDNEPELCRTELQLDVHGGKKGDLRGITVILQVDDEEYEEYSDSLGKVVFEKIKKKQLDQGEISFRVVND